MELSRGANECIVQAHMMRIQINREDGLCTEHLFYGLLLLARYMDSPLNKLEYRQEGEAVRAVLSGRVRSIESAVRQIKEDAKAADGLFQDAAAVIGRATEMAEMAGKNEIDAVYLARAVLESPTPTIRALMGLSNPQHAGEDAKYPDASPIPDNPGPAQKAEPESSKQDRGPTSSQFHAMLALLAAMEDKQHESLKKGANKQKEKKVKRWTKMGPFLYRGGTLAAAIQYFLFGIIAPLALLAALDWLTGAVSFPSSPFVGLLVNAFVVLWLCYLVRGVNKLAGLFSKPLSHFINILTDCVMLRGLAVAGMIAYGVAVTPTWLRVVQCIGAGLIICVGGTMFRHLSDQGDVAKTKIMFESVEGTPGMMFFRLLTKQLLFPLFVFSIIWIFRIIIPSWLEKVFWLIGFLWMWNVVFTMWNCMALRYKNSRRRHRGEVLVRFLVIEHVLLFSPGLGLYLHWLYGWFPMKTWVIVLYGVFGLFWLIASIAHLKQIREDC